MYATFNLVAAGSRFAAVEDADTPELGIWLSSGGCTWERSVVGQLSAGAAAHGPPPVVGVDGDRIVVVEPMPGATQAWIGVPE